MQKIATGSLWESELGYSRAVIWGDLVFTSATAAIGADGIVLEKDDAYRQTQTVFQKLAVVLEDAGSRLDRVIQTRIYLTDISNWRAIGRAHGETFREVRPAMSLIHVKSFLDPNILVEIELIASKTA